MHIVEQVWFSIALQNSANWASLSYYIGDNKAFELLSNNNNNNNNTLSKWVIQEFLQTS